MWQRRREGKNTYIGVIEKKQVRASHTDCNHLWSQQGSWNSKLPGLQSSAQPASSKLQNPSAWMENYAAWF